MSGFTLWDADTDAQNAPQRQARTAAVKLESAIAEVRDQYGPFLFASTGKDEFDDRWHYSKADIRKTVNDHLPPVTGVMRRVHTALRREFVATLGEDNADDPTKEPKDDKDGKQRTINDDQYEKVKKGDESVKDEVKTNTGDGSDSEGDHPSSTTGPQDDPRDSGPTRKKDSRHHAGLDEDDPDLHPDGDFAGYLDSVDNGGPEKVQAHDFGTGGDTGSDATSREARRIAVQLYQDWAASNGLKVASLGTLEHYADTGVDDSTYFLLANLIRRAECDCDDDDSDSDKGDSDSKSSPPPPPHADKDDDSDDDGGDSDAGDAGDSDDDSDDDSPEETSSEDSDSESGGDEGPGGGSEENPFAADDAAGPVDDGSGISEPDVPPDLGGDPAAGPPEAAGDQFTVPDTPPDLDPAMQDEIPADDTAGDAAIPPEVIDSILGLPPGTVESLVVQELMGGSPDAGGGDSGPPPPPPHEARVARRPLRRRAEQDPSAGNDPSAGGQAVAPAEASTPPDPAVASADDAGADNGALLDQAGQAITQLVDQKTQEYQRIIDPLTQAQQAIQFALEVEQAANPLDVTPPQGTVDVTPQTQAPQPPAGGPPQVSQPQQQTAMRIARAYGLSKHGYQQVLAAMSRKHYQHVAEAIQSLPPEHRTGIAASLADMFRADNVRFNTGQFLTSAGVDPRFVQASNPADRAWDAYASGRDRGVAEHGAYDVDPANWEDDDEPAFRPGHEPDYAQQGQDWARYQQMQQHNLDWQDAARQPGGDLHPDSPYYRSGSRRPKGDPARSGAAGQRTAAGWGNPAEVGAFKFKQTEQPSSDDNIGVNDLPELKTPAAGKTAKPLVDKFQGFENKRQQQGLGIGGDTDVDAYLQTHKVGPKGSDILHQQMGIQPHSEPAASGVKTSSFFTPKVAGWNWDDHLNGYVTDAHKPFRCTTAGCETEIPTPSQTMCKCGRLWYTYAIGEQQHLASGGAGMFLAREIPVRENVIMANRQFEADQAEDAGAVADVTGPRQDYAEDVDFYSDDELENAPTAHAPGETDVEGTRTARADYSEDMHEKLDDDDLDNANTKKPHKAATEYPDDHSVTYRNGERFCSACDAMLWDPNVHHCPVKQAGRDFFADWTVYDDESNKGYEAGPDGPPQTGVGSVPADWAKRGDGGKWAPPTFVGK